jgi:hypothetical protein
MPVSPPQSRLSRREVLSLVERGEVYRYTDPLSHWSAPGRRGYRVIVTAHVRSLIADGLVVEGVARGQVVYAAPSDTGRTQLATLTEGSPS